MVLAGAVALSCPLHVVALALSLRAFGLQLQQVQVFMLGVFSFRLRSTEVRVGVIPVGGYVRLVDDDTSLYEGLSAWQRIAAELAGCAVLLALAALVLGPRDAGAYLARSWVALGLGTVLPTSSGADTMRLVGAWASTVEVPWIDRVGVVFTAVAAVNLLPLPGLNGGRIVSEVLALASQRAQEAWRALGGLCLIALGIVWGVALITAIRGC